MLLNTLDLSLEQFAARTGWELKPEGACKGDICVPLAGDIKRSDGTVDVPAFAAAVGLALVGDAEFSLWALGPRTSGRVLDDDRVPEMTLQDFDGAWFDMASLRGRKVLLLAWASW